MGCKKAQQKLLRIETKKHRFRYNCKQEIRNMVKDSGMQKTKAKNKGRIAKKQNWGPSKNRSCLFFNALCTARRCGCLYVTRATDESNRFQHAPHDCRVHTKHGEHDRYLQHMQGDGVDPRRLAPKNLDNHFLFSLLRCTELLLLLLHSFNSWEREREDTCNDYRRCFPLMYWCWLLELLVKTQHNKNHKL